MQKAQAVQNYSRNYADIGNIIYSEGKIAFSAKKSTFENRALGRQTRFQTLANNVAQRENAFVGNPVKNRVAFLPTRQQTCVLQSFQVFADVRLG